MLRNKSMSKVWKKRLNGTTVIVRHIQTMAIKQEVEEIRRLEAENEKSSDKVIV